MKLLLITQKVDRNDPILGFFHRWTIEFSKDFESIISICLEKGANNLPDNVKVLSLGKEAGGSRLRYAMRFYGYIWRERKNYDAVFVHMNQEYLILAGWLWRLWGKRVTMWRNHHAGSLLTDIAAFFCHKIFCTSKYSYTAKYSKTIFMPIGIDVDMFRPVGGVTRAKGSILFLSRMSSSKRPDMFIESLDILGRSGVGFTASIYGDPSLQDTGYYKSLKERVHEARLSNRVRFHGGIPNEQTPAVYSSHEIFVNLSSSGMYDKTIFEAMACGCLAVSSNRNLAGQVDDILIFKEADVDGLTDRLEKLMLLDDASKRQILDNCRGLAERQALPLLAKSLRDAIESIA